MDVFSMVGVAITATVICVLVKEYKPEYAMLVSVACCILIFTIIIFDIAPIFEELKGFLDKISYNNEYLAIVVKALGICYVTQMASDVCADAGQSAIASKVELAGKAAVIVLSIPLFTNLMEMISNLLSL